MVGTTADFHRFGPRRSLPFNDLPGENRGTAGRIGEVGLGAFAEVLGAVGQPTEGLIAIDEALALSERAELHVSMPELLRVKGDLLRLKGESEVMGPERLFRQALDLARRQGALSYELRAATSLARLLRDQDRSGDAVKILQSVYHRFTEGFDTADLKAAKALLDVLG